MSADWGRFTPWRTLADVMGEDDRIHQWWFRFPNDLGLSVMEFPQRPGLYDALPCQWWPGRAEAGSEPPLTHWDDEQVRLPLRGVLTLLAAIEALEEPGELPHFIRGIA